MLEIFLILFQSNIAISENFILEILEIVIWPIIVVFVIHKFESEIKALVNRIQHFSAAGVNIDIQAQSQQQEAAEENKEVKNLSKEVETQKDIQKALLSFAEDAKKSKQEYELLYFFEKTYRLIFGSQLTILNTAKQFADGVSSALAEAIYRRTNWPNLNYSFKSYMNFLESNYLLEYDPSKDIYKMTPLGSLFLQYLNSNNIPLNKTPY